MTFCDSMGLGQILAVFQDCQKRRVGLLLVTPPSGLRRTLRYTGLDQVLQMRDSLHQALTELQEDPPEVTGRTASAT